MLTYKGKVIQNLLFVYMISGFGLAEVPGKCIYYVFFLTRTKANVNLVSRSLQHEEQGQTATPATLELKLYVQIQTRTVMS